MEKYENLGLIGEGSYGMVMKCRHKESGQLVAIKKFLESEDDKMVKKIAGREIRMLKLLRHDNLVNLLEVIKRKKRIYLVFEYVDRTVLDETERCPNGLDEITCKKIVFQVLRGLDFCHSNNVVHRDIKPENILISKTGIVKLCDFGFARKFANVGEVYTDYVATRWYRAPELLVGDLKYGSPVDVWAVGCLLYEMLTGNPLFPGDSDIDQLYLIIRCFGTMTQRYREIFAKNPLYIGRKLPEPREVRPFEKGLLRVSKLAIDVIKLCLQLDANDRPSCKELMQHEFFTRDNFNKRFLDELRTKIQREYESNPLFRYFSRDGSSTIRQRPPSDIHDAGGSSQQQTNQKTDSASKKEKEKKPMAKPPSLGTKAAESSPTKASFQEPTTSSSVPQEFGNSTGGELSAPGETEVPDSVDVEFATPRPRTRTAKRPPSHQMPLAGVERSEKPPPAHPYNLAAEEGEVESRTRREEGGPPAGISQLYMKDRISPMTLTSPTLTEMHTYPAPSPMVMPPIHHTKASRPPPMDAAAVSTPPAGFRRSPQQHAAPPTSQANTVGGGNDIMFSTTTGGVSQLHHPHAAPPPLRMTDPSKLKKSNLSVYKKSTFLPAHPGMSVTHIGGSNTGGLYGSSSMVSSLSPTHPLVPGGGPGASGGPANVGFYTTAQKKAAVAGNVKPGGQLGGYFVLPEVRGATEPNRKPWTKPFPRR